LPLLICFVGQTLNTRHYVLFSTVNVYIRNDTHGTITPHNSTNPCIILFVKRGMSVGIRRISLVVTVDDGITARPTTHALPGTVSMVCQSRLSRRKTTVERKLVR